MTALSPSATKAANEALWAAHPELRGRQLSSGPEDAALRAEWMRSYRGAASPAPTKAVGSPCATCAAVTAVTEQEIQEEVSKLRQLLIELSNADGLKETYDSVIKMFAFDSKWHDSKNNQRLFSFRGKTITGSDLNYYFQGVIWSWLDLPQFSLKPFAMAYKMAQWRQVLSPEARWAVDQGYRDGPSLLSPPNTETIKNGQPPSTSGEPAAGTVQPLRQKDASIYATADPVSGTLAPTEDDKNNTCVATAILMLERRTNPNMTIRVYNSSVSGPLPGYVNYDIASGVNGSTYLNEKTPFSVGALAELPAIVQGALYNLAGEKVVSNHAIVVTGITRENGQMTITYLDPYAAQAVPLEFTSSDSNAKVEFSSQGGTRVLRPSSVQTSK